MASPALQSPEQYPAQEEDVDIPVVPSPQTNGSGIPSYKTAFIQSCLSASVIKFGTFTLKSGRQSPYFFNAGLFHKASLIQTVSIAFAQTLIHYRTLNPGFKFDVLFGPAYKGIPLATATIAQLAELDDETYGDVSYCFNRKEVKDHGEGGSIVGAPLRGKRVVIIDDVITAGTAMRETIDIIKQQGGTLVGVVIALNRMERMNDEGHGSAIGAVAKEHQVPVLSIIDLNDLIGVLGQLGDEQDMLKVEEYKRRYGASD